MTDPTEFASPELRLEGRFSSTEAPVQAEGRVGSRPFYFRARWDSWSFAVALEDGVDPVLISGPDQGFYREDRLGRGRYAAGFLLLEEALGLISGCARAFLDQPQD